MSTLSVRLAVGAPAIRGSRGGTPLRFAVAVLVLAVAALAGDVAFAGTIRYTYDAANRLLGADYGGGTNITYRYDANGNLLNRTTAVATNADVRVAKTSPTTAITAGVNLTYTLTVTNAGPHAATGVKLTDTLPFGILLSAVGGASQGVLTLSNRTVIGDIGVLSSGSVASVTLTVFHGITNTATNTATVTAQQFDPDLSNNSSSKVTTGLTPSDSDGDGMPNWWETLYGLSPFSSTGNNGADGDPDNDGVRNLDEYIADTNPNDPNSVFRIENITRTPGSPDTISIFFQTSAIRLYTVQFTDDIANDPFATQLTLQGDGSLTIIDDDSAGANRSYRIGVEIPP